MGGRVMATIRLRYVHSFTDRHGVQRHYFRRHGKHTPLPGQPGSQAFMDAYGAALGVEAPKAPDRANVAPRSFAAIAQAYFASPRFASLSPSTRLGNRRSIERFLLDHGHRPVAGMKREHVDRIIGAMADRPGAAINLLSRLRTLVRYAIELRWIDRDPTAGATAWKSNEFHTWTEDEIAQFEARWLVGSKQRLAFALHLYTGQRGSDVHRMTWGDIDAAGIRVVQKKTGTKLTVPLHEALRSILAGTKKAHAVIVTTDYDRPFTVNGFRGFLTKAIAKAGLPARCKPHGLRKAAARRLAEAGCSAHEIQSITGHKTLSEVERYTRAADQTKLATSAIARQSANSMANLPGSTVANPPQKARKG